IGAAVVPLVVDTTSSGMTIVSNKVDQTSGRVVVSDTQYRDLAAYPSLGTIRLNAYNIGALAGPTISLTDADGWTSTAVPIQNTTPHFIDVQLPADRSPGGAYVTISAGGAKYFGTLFIDTQDNVPAVNGCTYETSLSSTLVPSGDSTV